MITAAAGTPQYSGNFIPEVWSSLLQVKYYDASVVPGIANTKYEGELKNQGDKVKIRTRPTIQTHDYEKGQELEIQHPDNPLINFPIERARYANFICDDIDAHQSDINLMEEWSTDAGEQLRMIIDEQCLGDVYADCSSYNSGATAGYKFGAYNLGTTGAPVQYTKDNALEFLLSMQSALNELNVPKNAGSRWYVLAEWMSYRTKISDLKDVSMTGDSVSVVRNNRMGMIGNATVHESNQVKSTTDGSDTTYYPMAGHKDAITFASIIRDMDTLKSERTIGRLVRFLQVYDWLVVKPEALATGYVKA